MNERMNDQKATKEERVRMSAGGRIVIPQHMRQAMGVEPGHDLLLRMDGDSLRVRSLRSAVKQSQAIVRSHVPQERSLAEELLRERRREAEIG